VLAAIGRYLIAKDDRSNPEVRSGEKYITEVLPWHEVDKDIAKAITETRKNTEIYASKQIKEWTDELMVRVDNDFLDWYFSYWTQQKIGFKGLYQYGVHYYFEKEPTAAEKLTEEIQNEFSKRVLRPQIAELELQRIIRDTANYYVSQLRNNIASIPKKYKIARTDWDDHIERLTFTVKDVDGNREVPVTLKVLTASGVGGTVLLAGKMKLLVGKLSSKVIAKSAGKAASKIAVKSGTKVVAKAGGKLLGTIVGVGVLIWDAWDHSNMVDENRPFLRQSMQDYFVELKEILLNDPEAGLMTTFNDLEKQVFSTLRTK
jgi:hypothetical protein